MRTYVCTHGHRTRHDPGDVSAGRTDGTIRASRHSGEISALWHRLLRLRFARLRSCAPVASIHGQLLRAQSGSTWAPVVFVGTRCFHICCVQLFARGCVQLMVLRGGATWADTGRNRACKGSNRDQKRSNRLWRPLAVERERETVTGCPCEAPGWRG